MSQSLNFTLRRAKSLASGFKVSPRHNFAVWNLSTDSDRRTVARSRQLMKDLAPEPPFFRVWGTQA